MVAHLIVIISVLAVSSDASASCRCEASFVPTSWQSSKDIQYSIFNTKLKERFQHQEYYLDNDKNIATREAAGISSGIGIWRDLRQSVKRRRRRTLEGLRTKNSGRRRRRLSSRFRNYLKRRRVGAKNESTDVIEINRNNLYDDDIENNTDVDSMRARSGVLRTKIRLRQEELTDLDLLMRDVSIELKRQEWENRDESNPGYKSVFSYDQLGKETMKGDDDNLGNINDIMNEYSLGIINKKWKERIKEQPISVISDTMDLGDEIDGSLEDSEFLMDEFQLNLMKKRSLELQSSILLDRIELQRLERRILCCESDELGVIENLVGNGLERINEFDFLSNPVTVARRQAKKFTNTFGESTSVLLRKLDRVSTRSGKNNKDYKSVSDFVAQETAAGVRIVGNLLSNPSQLTQLIDPDTPTLVPHVPAILARLDRLETHVSPILSQVLNNKQHLRTIEPYLGEILERFDDIEPHLPWILDHIDILAPYTGLLLKHIDELLLYAEVDEYEYEASGNSKDNYAFADQLLPYLEVYVSQLDLVGPHLPLLRPHLPLLLKHNRIKILSPHVGVLFAKGYTDLSGEFIFECITF